MIMSYLNKPEMPLDHISMKILVKAEGFDLSPDFRNLKIPMISEDNVLLAKRLIPFHNKIAKQLGYPEISESSERKFWPSRGNIILLGDIVLKSK